MSGCWRSQFKGKAYVRRVMSQYFELRDLCLCLGHRYFGSLIWPEYRERKLNSLRSNPGNAFLNDVAAQVIGLFGFDSTTATVFRHPEPNVYSDEFVTSGSLDSCVADNLFHGQTVFCPSCQFAHPSRVDFNILAVIGKPAATVYKSGSRITID